MSDQKDTLDEILTQLLNEVTGDIARTYTDYSEVESYLRMNPISETIKEAKAKLSALLVEARIDELNLAKNRTQIFGYYDDRIKELQQGASAYAESLTASGKQAATLTEIEFLKRLKLEFDANVSQHAGERWDDSDAAIMVNQRLAEVTTAASTEPLADDTSSKNASSGELEKQRDSQT